MISTGGETSRRSCRLMNVYMNVSTPLHNRGVRVTYLNLIKNAFTIKQYVVVRRRDLTFTGDVRRLCLRVFFLLTIETLWKNGTYHK